MEVYHGTLLSQAFSVKTITNLSKQFVPEDTSWSWQGHKHNALYVSPHLPVCHILQHTTVIPDAVAFVPETPFSLSCFDRCPPTPSPGWEIPIPSSARGHGRLPLLTPVSLTVQSAPLTLPQRENQTRFSVQISKGKAACPVKGRDTHTVSVPQPH